MFPHIDLGFVHVSSFSLMIFLGMIAFTVYAILTVEKREKTDVKTMNRILIVSAVGFAALGAFALFFNSLFHSIEQGRIVFGGITWLGGVIATFPLTVFLLHKFCPSIKGNALYYFNLLVPGIALAHAFGRIGCFLGGCCYGGVTDGIFGVSFPAGSLAAQTYPAADGGSLPVYPTQLFEATFEFLFFAVMMIFYKRCKPHFLTSYALGYGTFRFLLEFLRGDDRGATGLVLSPSQVMSLLLVAGGVLLILYQRGLVFKKLAAKMRKYREDPQYGSRRECGNAEVVELLKELKTLLDEEIITQEEFDEKKRELLQKL